MGTTLQNGVYLPNEGERNCYAGLKTNWEILDQKVADVTALQQAVAGALHREIVASLPTTDIDPNTIYMILSGTSATENVYDEFMYVNNAWELIGTSATDLTNYYTKGDVDGLLLLKANASDLTSHTGDTTIHVTASDKTKWTNSANTVVLRLAKTALTPSSSTNAFSNLDDSTALKVGDKVIDSSGVIYSVTAIDTANSTFTIGTALIDLAQDSDVVHKSGDETIAGVKTFSSTIRLTAYPNIRMYLSDDEWDVQPATVKQSEIRFTDKNSVTMSYFAFQHRPNSTEPFRTCWRQQKMDGTSGYYSIAFGNLGNFYPENDITITLGTQNSRWKSVYATNYYYGLNNIEFSTKFVTTDTNQTISGSKTFSSNVNVYNSDATATTPNLYLRSSKIEISSQGNTSGDQNLTYLDKNNTTYAYVKGAIQSNGSAVKIRSVAKDSSDNSVVNELQMLAYTNGNKAIFPSYSNEVDLGVSSYKWKSFNGVEPSSLSLPDLSNGIDISSYITHLDKVVNNYTPPSNGWLSIRVKKTSLAHTSLMMYQTGGLLSSYETTEFSISGANLPVIANKNVEIYIIADYLVSAKFFPCQGNI